MEKKLLYFLKQPSCLKTNLLKQFYEPAEQALIELCLKKQKGNRLKTAKLLGINRNTLKIKLIHYKLDVKKLWFKEKESCLEDKIFLSLLPSLDSAHSLPGQVGALSKFNSREQCLKNPVSAGGKKDYSKSF